MRTAGRDVARTIGTWVLIAKKRTRPGMAYADTLEEALCLGSTDGRPRSIWSLSNRRAAAAWRTRARRIAGMLRDLT